MMREARRLVSPFWPASGLLLAGLALSLTGCSFLFSKGPPDDYRERTRFDCSGYTAPLLDALWAALNGIGAMNVAVSHLAPPMLPSELPCWFTRDPG
jgi:hypothetical protein